MTAGLPVSPARRRTLAALAAPLAPLPVRSAAEGARIGAVVDAVIRPLRARHDVPGIALALAIDGREHFFGHGVTARRDGVPVTEATLFEIGSISKMFTATLAALGQASGKLSLQAHPGDYVAALRGRPIDRATLLHLGTYTAGGLPLQFPDAVRDDAAALAYLRDWQPEAPPGTVRRYSNPSIGLLGVAAAAAHGEAFDTLLASRLLPMFGLRRTYLQVSESAMADYAWGDRDGQPVRVNPGPLAAPTYGIKTTATDLLRFVQAQIDPSGLDPALRTAVEAMQVGRFRVGPLVQGFGWEQLPYPVSRAQLLAANSERILFASNPAQPLADRASGGPRLFGKTGSTGGFGAYVAFVPSRRIGLVMLANRSLPIPARIEAARTILARLAPAPR